MGGTWFKARCNNLQDHVSKITSTKWTEDVTQAIEHLICKCKALSSSPTPNQKIMFSCGTLAMTMSAAKLESQ
jgi:hypothetical protein